MKVNDKIVVILAVLIAFTAFTELAGSALNTGRRAALIKKKNVMSCGPKTNRESEKDKDEKRGCAHSSCASYLCGTQNGKRRFVKIKSCKI